MECVRRFKKLKVTNTTAVDERSCRGSEPVIIEHYHGDKAIHRKCCDFQACNDASVACICVGKLLHTPISENDWHDDGQFLRLNRKKCEDLLLYLNKAKESYKCLNKCELVAGEFLAAIQRAKFLVEESSDSKWLLKALELWDCSQHFFEVFVDLFWWVRMMSLGVDDTCIQLKCWVEDQEEKLDSPSHMSDAQTADREVLHAMVGMTLQNRKMLGEGGPKHQLALLLHDRLNDQSVSHPALLTRFKFFIHTPFNPLKTSKSGQTGVVIRFPWVYDKEFALKMLKPNSPIVKDMFKHEFDILDKHRSPYIVGVVGYWELQPWWTCRTPACPVLLMEAMEMNLEELMMRRPRGFSQLETITLMLPVAKALRFLHDKNIAHRDIKPQNIMCSNVRDDLDGITVKLVDFGEATEGAPEYIGPSGTNGYMDPAMWTVNAKTQKRDKNPDGYDLLKADVFSFAMVFSELLTWSSPRKKIDGMKEQDKLNSNERPSLPENLPEYVTFIVQCCWCADPTARPAFTDICSMLRDAKILLRDENFFSNLPLSDRLFRYEDMGLIERTIGDRAFS